MSDRDGQNIFLWAVPRSVSTGFFRTMESRKRSKVYLEPFGGPYYFGEERISPRYLDTPPEPDMTFEDIKMKLEEAVQTKEDDEIVFVKDMAYAIMQHERRENLIPKGFRHAFLVRDPYNAIKSLYKMSMNNDKTGWTHFEEKETGFKELWELYEYIRANVDPNAIVIDSSDMLRDPRKCFENFCNKMNISFEEEMLTWNENSLVSASVNAVWRPWFDGVLSCNTFQKPRKVRNTSSSELPESVMQCIDENMEYYDKFMDVKECF